MLCMSLGQRQHQRGSAVRSLRLEDTPHCGHFRLHRAHYCSALAAFLQHDIQVLSMLGALQCCGLPQAFTHAHPVLGAGMCWQ